MSFFNDEEFLAPHPTLKLENHPLSFVRYCLFNTFTATLHMQRPSPPSATQGHVMSWWQRPTYYVSENNVVLLAPIVQRKLCKHYYNQLDRLVKELHHVLDIW